MIFGYTSRLGTRGVVLLLVVAGLLIWSGRSDAASLGEQSGAPVAAGVPFDRLSGPAGAELSIRGEVAELRFRGGDPAALAARLAEAETAQVVVRIGGEDVLVAELRSVLFDDPRLAAVAARLLDPERISIGADGASVTAAALRTSGSLRKQEAPQDDPARLEPELESTAGVARADLAVATIPEPATGALLGTGMLCLVIASRRLRP